MSPKLLASANLVALFWESFKVGHGNCVTLVITGLFCPLNKLFQIMKKSWLDLEPLSNILMKIIKKLEKLQIKLHLLKFLVHLSRFLMELVVYCNLLTT